MRLIIDIQGVKQMQCDKSEGTDIEALNAGNVVDNAVRWIATSCMLVDCLTKRMNPMVMINSMKNGVLSLAATADSKLLQLRKKKLRQTKKEIEKVQCPNSSITVSMIGVMKFG